jgi:hypothetical protein
MNELTLTEPELLAMTKEPAMEWLPIESAPKDPEIPILAYCPEFGGAPIIIILEWFHERWEDIDSSECHPTHWMPLPAPPKVAV